MPPQGCSLAALADLESALLGRFGVRSFSELGLGPSLLSVLSQHDDLAEVVTGLNDSSAAQVPWQQVVMITHQACCSCQHANSAQQPQQQRQQQQQQQQQQHQAVTAALCRHFQVLQVEQLGYGSAAHVLAAAGPPEAAAAGEAVA